MGFGHGPNDTPPSAGRGTQFGKGQDPTRGGRPPSIRTALNRLLDDEGRVHIDATKVLDVRDDGSVVVQLPTDELLAMKALQWAMNDEGALSLAALKWVAEQIDGRLPIDMVHDVVKSNPNGIEPGEPIPVFAMDMSKDGQTDE